MAVNIKSIPKDGFRLSGIGIEDFKGDKLTFFSNLFFLLSFLTQTALILAWWGKLPSQVPLFYSRPWGEKILAAPIFLWILPGILALSFLTNKIMSNIFVKEGKFLVQVIAVFSILISFATLWGTLKIFSLLT